MYLPYELDDHIYYDQNYKRHVDYSPLRQMGLEFHSSIDKRTLFAYFVLESYKA